MARITVEDCLEKVGNRFALIHLAAKRVRQLRKGSEPLYLCKNKDIVTALREIAAGHVYPEDVSSLEEPDIVDSKNLEPAAIEAPPSEEEDTQPEETKKGEEGKTLDTDEPLDAGTSTTPDDQAVKEQ